MGALVNAKNAVKRMCFVEFLTVVAIIAILAAMLLPALAKAKQRAQQRQQQSQTVVQPAPSGTTYKVGETVYIERDGEILKGKLVKMP